MNVEEWQRLHSLVSAQFRLDPRRSAHAADHWERVRLYGKLIGERIGADLLVVRLFSLLHDSQRDAEGNDPDHGPRAALYAESLSGTAFELEPGQLELLMTACREHDQGGISRDLTVGTCWDADRLDLDRVGIAADASYMSTGLGRELADLRPRDRQEKAGIITIYGC